jgi:hypothetical protein
MEFDVREISARGGARALVACSGRRIAEVADRHDDPQPHVRAILRAGPENLDSGISGFSA